MIDNSDLYSIRSWDSENLFDLEMDTSKPMITNSSASSDCGDEFFDLSGGRIYNLTDADYLELPIAQILDCSLSDWVNEVTCPSASTESVTDVMNSPRRKDRRQSRKKLNPFEIKKWSKLNIFEQINVVDQITQIISTQMDFREQLDIIRIIDPQAVVSNTDKQFDIDVTRLNDHKWKAVKDFILRNTNIKIKTNRNCRKRKIRNQAEKKNTKREDKLEEQIKLEEDRLDKSKRKRQLRKEHRSGLFEKEEILSLSSSHVTEEDVDILDEDIDILH